VSEPWGALVTMSSCFVICKWNWLFISSLSAPLPSYEGLSTQWCSVFYHHLGTQQNDRMCLVGEAANFRKVFSSSPSHLPGFFFASARTAEISRTSPDVRVYKLEGPWSCI
jgi:hypothetical protein